MRLCGLDSALRKSGAAVLDGDRFVEAQAFHAKGESQAEAFHQFRVWWRAFLIRHEVDRAAVEEPLRSDMSRTVTQIAGDKIVRTKQPITNMQTLLGLYGVRAHAIEVCHALNIPCVEINNQDWRNTVYGQRRAPKSTKDASEWWKQKALERCKQLGWSVPSKDAAESAMIAEALRISLSPLGRLSA